MLSTRFVLYYVGRTEQATRSHLSITQERPYSTLTSNRPGQPTGKQCQRPVGFPTSLSASRPVCKPPLLRTKLVSPGCLPCGLTARSGQAFSQCETFCWCTIRLSSRHLDKISQGSQSECIQPSKLSLCVLVLTPKSFSRRTFEPSTLKVTCSYLR